MNPRFEFATSTRIVFGAGTVKEIGSLARGFGKHALVVTGRDPRRAEFLVELLKREPEIFAGTPFSVPGEPTLTTVAHGVTAAKMAGCGGNRTGQNLGDPTGPGCRDSYHGRDRRRSDAQRGAFVP